MKNTHTKVIIIFQIQIPSLSQLKLISNLIYMAFFHENAVTTINLLVNQRLCNHSVV